MRFNPSEYDTVDSRIQEWYRTNPDGRITTRLLEERKSGQFIVEAHVWVSKDDVRPKATGLAEESLGGRGANKDAALENAETSAIGRALANAGLSGSGNRPTVNEMQKSERVAARAKQAEKPAKPKKAILTKGEKEKLAEIAKKHNVTSVDGKKKMVDAVLAGKSFNDVDDLAAMIAQNGVDGLKNLLGAEDV